MWLLLKKSAATWAGIISSFRGEKSLFCWLWALLERNLAGPFLWGTLTLSIMIFFLWPLVRRLLSAVACKAKAFGSRVGEEDEVASAPAYWYWLDVVLWFSTLSLSCCSGWDPRHLWWQTAADSEPASERVRWQREEAAMANVAVACGGCGIFLVLVGTQCPFGHGEAGIPCAVFCEACAPWFPEHEWWFLWPWLSQLFP